VSPELLLILLRSSVFIVALLTAFAYLTYTERRVLSWFQWRVGPNRVGPWGLFQPIADGVKTVLKQEMIPAKADRKLYMMAPAITLAAAFTMFAVIPVGEQVVISSVPIAVLIFLGLSSLGAYGIILAGWASQSRYPFLGSLRACAQVISYELPLGITMLVPVLITGSLDFSVIGNMYRSPEFHPAYLLVLIPTFAVFIIAALAETGRVPFDLPECEAEIVAGYHTEYSSMKYAMFPMGEYIAMCAMCAVATHLFLGGYHLSLPGIDLTNWAGLLSQAMGGDLNFAWGPPDFLRLSDDYWAVFSVGSMGLSTTLTFLFKMALLVFAFMWVRATLPRLRYDQLMQLGWKRLLPISLVLVFLTSTILVLLPETPAASTDSTSRIDTIGGGDAGS
jgi:NADH-quinone oxidoreductase subunit H